MKTKCNCPDCTFPECDCWNVRKNEDNCENWENIAGHIKHLICMYDHVNDDPNKIISDINNVLDDAFGDMDAAIKKISLQKDNSEEGEKWKNYGLRKAQMRKAIDQRRIDKELEDELKDVWD